MSIWGAEGVGGVLLMGANVSYSETYWLTAWWLQRAHHMINNPTENRKYSSSRKSPSYPPIALAILEHHLCKTMHTECTLLSLALVTPYAWDGRSLSVPVVHSLDCQAHFCFFVCMPQCIYSLFCQGSFEFLVLFGICHTTTTTILNSVTFFRTCVIVFRVLLVTQETLPVLRSLIMSIPHPQVKSHSHVANNRIWILWEMFSITILALSEELSSLPLVLSMSYLSILTTWWLDSRAARDVWESSFTCLEPVLGKLSVLRSDPLGLFSICISMCLPWMMSPSCLPGR